MPKIFQIVCVLSLAILLEGNGLRAEFVDPLTTIELDSSVHFLSTDGSDVEIASGTYTVEPAEDWIRLIPGERRDALLIEAERGRHSMDIDGPLAMGFGSGSPEQADLYLVMLLLPGGESMEATGTLSGIRPRGFNLGQAFNNAKKTANNAYNQAKSTANQAADTAANAAQQAAQQGQQAAQQGQQTAQQAGQQAQQAASTVQKGLQGAQAAALKAKQAVEQQARQAGQTIAAGVQTQVTNIQNNPLVAKLESEIQTLEAVRKLNLEPLFTCLRQSSGLGSTNVPYLVQRFANNPPEFANWLFQEVMRQWEQNFSDIMAEQLQVIRNPSRSAPQGPEVIGMAFRSLEKLAEKGPGGRCLMQFVRPHLQTIQATSGHLQQAVTTQGRRMFDTQVAPILFGSLSKQIGDLLSAAISLTPQDIARAGIRSRGFDPNERIEEARQPADGRIVSRGFSETMPKRYWAKLCPV